MSEPKKILPFRPPVDPERMAVTLTVGELRELVERALEQKANKAEDHLLKVEDVAKVLAVDKEWLYHHAKTLPFTRKVGGMLRFSANGLQRYIEKSRLNGEGD